MVKEVWMLTSGATHEPFRRRAGEGAVPDLYLP